MKQDKDWIEVMRNALRDAELPPPAGGWEALQRELDGAAPEPVVPAGARRPAWRIYWPRIAAAAAAVLICVVAGEFLLRPDKALDHDGNVIASATEDGATAASIPQQTEPGSVQQTLAQAVGLSPERPARTSSSIRRQALPAAAVTQSTEPLPVVEARAGEAGQPADQALPASGEAATRPAGEPAKQTPATAQKRASGRAATRSSGDYHRSAFDDEPFVAYTPPRKKASFSLFGAGGMSSSTNGTLPPPRTYSAVTNDVSGILGNGDKMAPLYRNDYSESSFRHHQTLSFGVAVRKEFAHGLSLESGINYSLLRSDVRMQYSSDDMSQKLHFIGIPLRLNWQFFERGRFSLFAGAGGMVEKCVSAKLGTESVDESGVQWSALAAVGAQYRLGGMVGLYFEPEGSYYFTETGLRTSRTDSPLTLTLRLGVRLSF